MTKKNLTLSSQYKFFSLKYDKYDRSTHTVPNQTQISERSIPIEASSTTRTSFGKFIPSFTDLDPLTHIYEMQLDVYLRPKNYM